MSVKALIVCGAVLGLSLASTGVSSTSAHWVDAEHVTTSVTTIEMAAPIYSQACEYSGGPITVYWEIPESLSQLNQNNLVIRKSDGLLLYLLDGLIPGGVATTLVSEPPVSSTKKYKTVVQKGLLGGLLGSVLGSSTTLDFILVASPVTSNDLSQVWKSDPLTVTASNGIIGFGASCSLSS